MFHHLKLSIGLSCFLFVVLSLQEDSLSALCFARGCGNEVERPAWGGNGGWWGGGRVDWFGNDAANSSRFPYAHRPYRSYCHVHHCQEIESVNGGALYWKVR